MDSLVRKALLGDKKSQEECTEKGIALPCPFCGNENNIISNWGMFRVWCPHCKAKSEDTLTTRDALKSWNPVADYIIFIPPCPADWKMWGVRVLAEKWFRLGKLL
jgi:hypothetical protein